MSKHPATCDYTRIGWLKWCCDNLISKQWYSRQRENWTSGFHFVLYSKGKLWLSICSNCNWNAVAASVGGNAMTIVPPQDTSWFSRLLLQPTFHLLFVVQLLFGTSIIWQILQEWQTIYLQTLSNYKFSLTLGNLLHLQQSVFMILNK